MGIIRGATVTVLSIILLLSFFLMAISLTLSWSLEYETIKPELKNSINELASEQFSLNENIEGRIVSMQTYCLSNEEFVFEEEGYVLEIPCNVVSKGSNAVIDFGIDSIIEKIYYQEYNCGFWKCIKETGTPFVLLSENAMSYWKSKFYLLLLISVILSTLIFLISHRKHNAFLLTGILMIVSVLPLVKINFILSSPLIPKSLGGIIQTFFTKSYNVFLIMFIIGFLIFLFGISLHFFGLGSRIARWLSRNREGVSSEDVKEIVHAEISKKKSKKGEMPISSPEENTKKHISRNEIKKIVKEEISKKEINKK